MDRSRIVKRIYVERRRMMYEGQGRGDGSNWLQKTRTLLVELGLGAEWESEAVGTKQQWEKSSQLHRQAAKAQA